MLPQAHYFDTKWSVPGKVGWTLQGHSRALERSGFWIPEAGIMLDAGIDLPSPETPGPRMILVTHTHIDHSNAMPMLARHSRPEAAGPVLVFSPRSTTGHLMTYTQLSWTMKVGAERAVPEWYKPPGPATLDAVLTAPHGEPVALPGQAVWRQWYPVDGDKPDSPIRVVMGRHAASGTGSVMLVRVLAMDHTVPAVGYLLSEERQKLRPDLLVPGDKAATGKAVQAARARGEDVNVLTEIPQLAYLCDTSSAVFGAGVAPPQLAATPVIMVECSYLGADMCVEGAKRHHVVWAGANGLRHFVLHGPCGPRSPHVDPRAEVAGAAAAAGRCDDAAKAMAAAAGAAAVAAAPAGVAAGVAASGAANASGVATSVAVGATSDGSAGAGAGAGASAAVAPPVPGVYEDATPELLAAVRARHQTWVLIHFSLRYRDADVAAFFSDEVACGLKLTTDAPPCGSPPLLVLWLDSGVVQLWLAGSAAAP